MAVTLLTVHVSGDPDKATQVGFDAAESVGFDVDRESAPAQEEWPSFDGSYKETSVSFKFDLSGGRDPYERILAVVLSYKLDRSNWSDGQAYVQFVDAVVDLACELAAAYDAEYVPLLTTNQYDDIAPTGMPFAEHIDQVPEMAVYSQSLLSELGGFEELYGGTPWRYAELDSGHVFVMTADGPWRDTEFTDSQRRNLQGSETTADVELSDPFTALEPGEYGTDAVITKADIAPEFSNEALTLERCYRDESDNLRRVEDDSFVRRLVGADGAMGAVPDDADSDDERISALIEGSIPPAFVRLDDPEGQSIVSKVMALDIETSKFELLVRLAQIARADDVDDEALATIRELVETLGGMDDADGIDQYIQAKIL